MRALAALLAVLLLAGCSARTGPKWSLAGESSSRSSSSSSEPSEEPEKDNSSGEGEDGEDDADVDAADFEAVDADAVATQLFDDGLAELCINYMSDSFDHTDDIIPANMLWGLYWMYVSSHDPDQAHDYDGYDQMSQRDMDKLIARWFGPDAPEFEPKENVPIDKTNGESVQMDREHAMYYFLNLIEPKDEEFSDLKSAKADDDGVVTIRFNTRTSKGDYANSYIVKAKANEEGDFYLISFNRGKSA